MRRPLGWVLFLVGGFACLLGMFGLAGWVGLPLDVGVTELVTDSDLIDWMILWLVVWAAGLFMLAKKKPAVDDEGAGH